MRRITWLTILSVVLLFGFVGTAFATTGDNNTDITSPTSAEVNATILQLQSSGQKIHSGYMANTDACAVCHAPHKAVGADYLLKWASEADACMACHDGTVTAAYNVETGKSASGLLNSAGKFGFNETTNRGHSAHGVGVNLISSAPGGNIAGVKDAKGTWGTTTVLECSSCHAPHGNGGNPRILNPDPNGIATINAIDYSLANKTSTPALAVSKSVYAVNFTTTDYLTYKDTHTGAKGNWIAKPTVYVNATGAVPVAKVANLDYTFSMKNGTVTFKTALNALDVVDVIATPGVAVKMTITNPLQVNEKVSYDGGMNNFCAACHTDYAAPSGSRKPAIDPVTKLPYDPARPTTSTYVQAYRHTTNGFSSDKGLNNGLVYETTVSGTTTKQGGFCLTCHFAHGTDDQFSYDVYSSKYDVTKNAPILPGPNALNPADTVGRMVTADTTRSSALKRLPNMGVCEACHGWGIKQGTY